MIQDLNVRIVIINTVETRLEYAQDDLLLCVERGGRGPPSAL